MNDSREYMEPLYTMNPQELPIGSIAYYIRTRAFREWKIEYGLVEMHYPHNIVLTMLDGNMTGRSVEGIPYNDFTMTEWRKLPKGWRYDTQLFTIDWDGYEELNQKYQAIDITDPESILKAYNERTLVKVEENDYGRIESEVDSKHGYRIVKHYPMFAEPHPWNKSFLWNEVFKDYSAAKQVIDKQMEELKGISEMDDREYSIHEFTQIIDRALELPKQYREDCKQFLLEQDKVEDIVVRSAHGGIEWKYDKNKRWNMITYMIHT